MKLKSYLLIFILIFITHFGQEAFSQTKSYQNIKVDQLSDEQVSTMIRRAESIGYSDLQLEQMARAEGMKDEEVAKLRIRIRGIRAKQGVQERDRGGAESLSSGRYKNNTTGDSNRDARRQLNYQDDNNKEYGNNGYRSNGYASKGYSNSEYGNNGYGNNDYNTSKYGNNGYGNNEDTSNSDFDSLGMSRSRDAKGNKSANLKVFGADLFNSKSLTFQPDLNMPTPKGYVIGPNDELLIDISGDNEVSYQLTVSPEGSINLEYVGRVVVGGLSIEVANSKIRTALSTAFPAIKSGRTQVSLTLGNIRSIKVTIIGEVTKPGTYTLPSLATVFNALYASGGPTKNGSFRKIQLVRNNSVVSTLDIYDFLLKGMQATNIGLEDQDVIHVPVFETHIEMTGEVKRPAIYEMIDSERLEDALHFAGGFTTSAYTANIKIFQNTKRERKISDIPAEEFASYQPKNGDQYVVEPVLDRYENRVTIRGAVFRPGEFEVKSGMTLRQLIEKADGIKEEAFLPRAYLYRLKEDHTQELITFNLADVIAGRGPTILLQREDIVQISSLFDLRDEYKVQIQGEVRDPQSVPYAENMTVGSLIQMAGGFKEGASPQRLEISRRKSVTDDQAASSKVAEVYTINIDDKLRIEDNEFLLMPYDIVSVRGDSRIVPQMQIHLEGEVRFPGFYTISDKKDRISDLIERSGGLTEYAYAAGASLKRNSVDQKNKKPSLGWLLEVDDDKAEEERKLLNLRRLSQDKSQYNLSTEDYETIIASDLLGIKLNKILERPHSRWDIYVEDGDVIKIPKALQTVKITGEVRRPNNVVYFKQSGFKRYIDGAGGYTRNASKSGAYVQYANGSVDATKKVLFFFNKHPVIEPGAEVFVPVRAPREKVSAQGWVAISTAMVSMAAMVFAILR